jgi:cardiolipin synthase (CMP-forming)
MTGIGHIGFWTLANVLTLSRIPFGIAFWFVADRPIWALAVMIVGGATDLVDGWVARRRGQAGRNGVGAWLDPVCDKFFVLSMVAALLTSRRPAAWIVVAIAAREVVVVPLALAYRLLPGVRRRLSYDFRAGRPGKLATLAQFAALTAILFGSAVLPWIAALAGVVGLAAAGDYVRRALRAAAPRDPVVSESTSQDLWR